MNQEEEMSKHSIQIAFEGPDVNGKIDVREFAVFIDSLMKLYDEANLALNGKKNKIHIYIGKTEHGSFLVNIDIILSFIDRVLSFLPTEKNYSAREITEFLGLSISTAAIGYVAIKKWLKGKPYQTIKENQKIFLESDGKRMEISQEAEILLQNSKIAASFFGLFSPLECKGINNISLRKEKHEIQSINKNEFNYFNSTQNKSQITSDFIVEKICAIHTMSFDDDLSWKLYDGETRFSAKMCDEEFIQLIDKQNIAVLKKDMFKMRIKTNQFQDSNGNLKANHEVIKVLSNNITPEQLELNF